MHTGTELRVGEYYCPIITINDFPMETYPGILDALNRADIEYRWVSRFICLDKEDALKAIESYQKKYYGSRRNWKQFASEAMTKEVTDARVNQGALSMEADANEAQVECVNDVVGYGYYTSCLQVWDKDHKAAQEKASYAQEAHPGERVHLHHRDFELLQGLAGDDAWARVREHQASTGIDGQHGARGTDHRRVDGTEKQFVPGGNLRGGRSASDLQYQFLNAVLPQPARRGCGTHLHCGSHGGGKVNALGASDGAVAEVPRLACDPIR